MNRVGETGAREGLESGHQGGPRRLAMSSCSVVFGPKGICTQDRQAGVQRGAGWTPAASEHARKELKQSPLVIWKEGRCGWSYSRS